MVQKIKQFNLKDEKAARIVINVVERGEALEPDEVEPDEWDLEMIRAAEQENDGTYISFDEVLEKEGLTYADLQD